jgi:UPF0755 protein
LSLRRSTKNPKTSSRGRWLRRAGVTLAAAVFVLALGGVAGFWALTHRSLPISRPVLVFVHRGEPFDLLARRLQARGIVRSWWILDLAARIDGAVAHIRRGQYRLRPGMNVWTLLTRLTSNHVVLYRFTIVPGETYRAMARALASDPILRGRKILNHPRRLLRRLGSHAPSPEGLFLPQTYDFPYGTSVSVLLARAYRRMHVLLQKLWKGRAQGLSLKTPYQALILASLVERESSYRPERPRIAEVFLRRLRLGIPLESDPTVIYAMGSRYRYPLTARDLSYPSPWNTYLHRGLPPTPICDPSRNALQSVLHPAPGRDLYFVVTRDGRHVFAKTLAGQDRNIRLYEPPAAPSAGGGDHRR